MIKLTTLDKREIFVNADLIEQLESVPETMLTLVNGKKILVLNTPDNVVQQIINYHKNIFNGITGCKSFEVK